MELNVDQLIQDAKLARMLGEATDAVTVDNGSCNLDATFYSLRKGERAEPVVRAFRAAGLHALPTRWIGRGVMVQPPTQGQANRRHAANEAMYESLSRAGWPVTPYHQMD
jgi:hypothetical protein